MATWSRVQNDGQPLKRLGMRGRFVGHVFGKLPKKHKTAEVYLALCRVAGIDEDQARDRWGDFIAFLEGTGNGR